MRMRRRGPGLIRATAGTAVVAGTATAVSGRVARRQQQRYGAQDAAYAQQQSEAMAEGFEHGAPGPEAGQPDYVAELEQLSALKAQGILTDEEFEAKKKQILGI